jgi:hypothetical protein
MEQMTNSSFASVFLERCLVAVLAEGVQRQQGSALEAEKTEYSIGDLSPREIAIAVPNIASRTALASETHRGRTLPHSLAADGRAA